MTRMNSDNAPNSQPCPCCSASFAECCEAILSGAKRAETAEQLMRARFSAFALEKLDFLVETGFEVSSTAELKRDLQRTFKRRRWLSLTVLSTESGTGEDATGVVDFRAVYSKKRRGSPKRFLRERSDFKRRPDGSWFYSGGKHLAFSGCQPEDPCWCLSGKAYSECHPGTWPPQFWRQWSQNGGSISLIGAVGNQAEGIGLSLSPIYIYIYTRDPIYIYIY